MVHRAHGSTCRIFKPHIRACVVAAIELILAVMDRSASNFLIGSVSDSKGCLKDKDLKEAVLKELRGIAEKNAGMGDNTEENTEKREEINGVGDLEPEL